jgi:hypothetical protein
LPRLAPMPHGDVAPALVRYGLFLIAFHAPFKASACPRILLTAEEGSKQ